MDARFERRVGQGLEVQAGRSELGRCRDSGTQTGIRWEEKKRIGESPPSQTLSRHGTIHESGKKMKKGRRGRLKKGEGEEGWHRHYCLPASSSSDLSLAPN